MLQVATNVSGRGVLRLIWLQQHINLVSIPLIIMQLIILAYPTTKLHFVICIRIDCYSMLCCWLQKGSNFKTLFTRVTQNNHCSCNFKTDLKSLNATHSVEFSGVFTYVNRHFSSLAIALGR